MARLRLTLHNFSYFKKEGLTFTKVVQNVLLSTEKEDTTLCLPVGDSADTKLEYNLNIANFGFQKKMYQPTEITADIQISLASGNDSAWQSIGRKQIDTLFKHLQVSLEEVPANDSKETAPESLSVNDTSTIGDDFYVHEVLPHYQSDGMYVMLKIFSLDKLLTLRVASRAFTARRLSAILKDELGKYEVSYTYPSKDKNGKEIETTTTQKVKADLSKMKQFGTSGKDHIFPYLVQYNETFYDMLARTCNRWGEFMYYEDKALHVGYDSDASNVKSLSGFSDIHYFDCGTVAPTISEDGFYDLKAANEAQFIGNVLKKSPYKISGNLFYPTGKKWDKVLMKEITSFFKNDKNVPTWLGNRLFDNTWDLAVKLAETKKSNDKFDGDWFSSSKKAGADDQYKDWKEFNQFTEHGTKFKDGKYKEILAAEEVAGKNAIHVDFSTTCPRLKLGNIIEYNDEKFIVVEINCRKETKMEYSIGKDIKGNDIIVETPNSALLFDVVATACEDAKNNLFYPAVIPAGHVRLADPQIATIVDDADPTGSNQVRVVFPWQYNPDDKSDNGAKDPDSAADDPTPWLKFATSSAGSPTIGKHYAGDEVLVGFVDGNVERPYVMGVLASNGDEADYIQTTPGGHKFKLKDDEDGIKNFLTGMFMPCVETLSPFLTAIPGASKVANAICKPAQGDKNNLAMGGGFEISDNYGIYKIAGSTDGREVAIASPWGEVNINAFTGITISAPNGDVTIKGKNIKLEAGNNIDIISGTNVKNKILGGDRSGFGADVATAVAKKLADKLTSIIDLSTVRSAIEVVFRPAEGALRIKSNRFLMLEAGKGKCVYPKDAYKDNNAYNAAMDELKKQDFRPGMKLASGTVQMFSKVITLSDMFDTRFMSAYNICVNRKKAFDKLLKDTDICSWHNKYSDSNKTPQVCKSYTDLISKFWADNDEAISEADLGFTDDFKAESANVDNTIKKRFADKYNGGNRTTEYDAQVAEHVVAKRKEAQKSILSEANELRKAIVAFRKLPQLTEKEIQKTFSTFRDRNLPKDYRTALVNAFKKDKLVDGDDVFYFKAPSEDMKKLLNEFTKDSLKGHRIILARKAAILTLEGMGFKDEWRQKKQNPDYGMNGKPTKNEKYLNELDVVRKFNASDLSKDTYWNSYVDSLVTIPKLSSTEFKAVTELKKKMMDNLRDLKVWESCQENDSWGEAKKGSILFSSDEKIYNLKKTIDDVPAPWKERLTVDDNADGDVTSFLEGIKKKMKDIK